MLALLFVSLFAAAQAETAANMAARCTQLGQTFLSEAEVAGLCTCMETPLYDQKNLTGLKDSAMSCAIQKINPMKYSKGMSILDSFNTCIKPSGDTWQTLLDKFMNKTVKIWSPPLNECNNTLSSWKAAKTPKATCISNGYKMIMNNFANVQKINNYCEQIINGSYIGNLQWQCALKAAPQVLDLTKYACARLKSKVAM